jgi:hypothetical protein
LKVVFFSTLKGGPARRFLFRERGTASRTPERARRASRSTPRARRRTRASVGMEAHHAEQSSLEEIMSSLCVFAPPVAQLAWFPSASTTARAEPATADLTLSSSPRLHRPPPHQRAAQPSHGQGVLRTRRRRDAPRGGALSSRLGLRGSAGRASTRVASDALGGARDAFQDPPPQDAPACAGDRRRAPGVPGRLRAQALRAFSFRARAVPRDVSSRGGPAGRGGLFQFPAEQRRRRRRRARGPRRAVEAGEARGHVPCPVRDRDPSVTALQAER